MIRAVVTFGFVGFLRPASGTWGSLAALPAFWALHAIGGPALCLVGIAAAAVGGLVATGRYIAGAPDKDPSEIVIDEVAGQWIALLPLTFGAARTGADITALWPGWIAAFLLFRLFDIWKPGPVGWADRQPGATGVMLDDLIAGVFAAAGVVALAALFHLFLL